MSIFKQNANIQLPKRDPFIFRIKVDFAELWCCKQTHHWIMMVVQNARHVSQTSNMNGDG